MKKYLLLFTLIFLAGCSAQNQAKNVSVSNAGSNAGEAQAADDPWMLQDWCADHPEGCTKYDVHNQTESWVQVDLKNTETGEAGFFTVQSKQMAQITLIPGQYQTTFTWWCDGKTKTKTEIMPIGRWKDYFKCPKGHYLREKK